MTIHELTVAECEELLSHSTIGRLGCALGNQPYIVPIFLYFERDERCLYSFATLGKKIEWMRTNPKVCVEVDKIASQFDWTTVLATGSYEELHQLSEVPGSARSRARELFQQHSQWWLPAAGKLDSGVEHEVPVIYRIHITSLSGRTSRRSA